MNDDDDSKYLASNFLRKKNNDDSKYAAKNFLKKEKQPGWLERNANFAEENINKPIESLGRSARDIAGGFGQGLANIGPGLLNLGISGVNALLPNRSPTLSDLVTKKGDENQKKGMIPHVPMIDVVPHSPSAEAGNVLSFFAPGSIIKALSKAPAFMHATRSTMKIPMIAEGIKHASNILGKSPLATRLGGNAILGGAYSPDNPLIGMGLGAVGGAVGEAAGKGYAGIKNLLANNEPIKNAISNPKSLLTTKNSIKNDLLNKHDFLENKASNAFNHVSDEVNTRGINHIPLEHHLPDDFFEKAKNYFPNTMASENLLNKAKTGDYNSLRKMQSDLYKRAKKNLSSQFDADNLKGAEMLEKRNDINQAISNHLKNKGQHDLSKILDEARADWRTLQNTYYNENVSNSLIKMFDKNVRKIPKNLVNLLTEESIPMKNILNFHPGLEQKVMGNKLGQGALKKAGKYALPVGLGLTGYEVGKHS